jgi:hypothetical protein
MGRGGGVKEALDLEDVIRTGLGGEDGLRFSLNALLAEVNEFRIISMAFDPNRNPSLSNIWSQRELFSEMKKEEPDRWNKLLRLIAFIGKSSNSNMTPEAWITERMRDYRFYQNLSPYVGVARTSPNGPRHLKNAPYAEKSYCGVNITQTERPRAIDTFEEIPCQRCLAKGRSLLEGPEEVMKIAKRTFLPSKKDTEQVVKEAVADLDKFIFSEEISSLEEFAKGLERVSNRSLNRSLALYGVNSLYSLQPAARLARLTYPYPSDGGEPIKQLISIRRAILDAYGAPEKESFPWPRQEEMVSLIEGVLEEHGDIWGESEERVIGHILARLFPRMVTAYARQQGSTNLYGNELTATFESYPHLLLEEEQEVDPLKELPV